MKKIPFLLLLIVIFPLFTLWGQEQIDVIYLNNGDIIKGSIIENVLDNYISIELSNGETFTYKYSEILSYTLFPKGKLSTTSQQQQRHTDILSSSYSEQPRKGNIGITASLQNSQLDFLVPFFVTNNLSLSPAFGFSSNTSLMNISLGAILRYYLAKGIVSPFIGGRFATIISSPKNGDALINLVLGTLSGGEYFFSKHFSVGIELQVNVLNSLGNSNSINVNTATAFFATIYF